jgi:hypothetical protein
MISSNLLACTTAGPQCLPSRAPERRGFLRIALRSETEAASFGKQCRPAVVPERPLNGGDNSVLV